MGLSVHVVCSNWEEDRVLARMARALRDRNGWTLSSTWKGGQDARAVFCGVYFEVKSLDPWPAVPVGAYFTHREEEPPGTLKAKLFDETAKRVALRVVTARMYGEMVERYGPTVQVHAPVERERFTIPDRPDGRTTSGKCVVGLSGYVYANKRKGEDLVKGLVGSAIGRSVEWRACGRGWPVPTKRLVWEQMPEFYQGLDVLVCTSRVEGIPMPPLEALACGVSVVIPRHVGVLDELGEVKGIYRYDRGSLIGLQRALAAAVDERAEVDREALRGAIEGHSVEAWCEDIERAMESVCGSPQAKASGKGCKGPLRGLEKEMGETPVVQMAAPEMAGVESEEEGGEVPEIVWEEPVERGTGSTRGIYCVAFGGPARSACEQMMRSAKQHMPEIPIALCAAEPIGPEDLLIEQPDSDIGGRRAKLRAYELAPAEWKTVLYLDADIKIIAPVYPLFQWIEDGWELAICTDVPPNDLLAHIGHKTLQVEARETARVVGTGMALQFNGGVWSFGRGPQVEAFFRRWRAEWERWGAKDQGALLRAYHTTPLRTWVLGNEWNCFPKFQPNQSSAGILHFPGDARRWTGQIRGRIDSREAWDAVEAFERKRPKDGGR